MAGTVERTQAFMPRGYLHHLAGTAAEVEREAVEAGVPFFSVAVAGLDHHRWLRPSSPWTNIRPCPGSCLQLIREPGNPADLNAVRVDFEGAILGYLPRYLVEWVAPRLDAGEDLRAYVDFTQRPERWSSRGGEGRAGRLHALLVGESIRPSTPSIGDDG